MSSDGHVGVPSDGRQKQTKIGLVIINPYGGVWADEIFETPEAALAYLEEEAPMDLTRFSLAMGVKTVEIYRPPGEPTRIPWPVSR